MRNWEYFFGVGALAIFTKYTNKYTTLWTEIHRIKAVGVEV